MIFTSLRRTSSSICSSGEATCSPSTRIIVLGGDFRCGSYLLRIQLGADLQLRFGRFKRGKLIHLAAGDYAYVGSALSTKGAASLGLRLIRHATRSGDRPPHRIRSEMTTFFKTIGLIKESPPERPKRLHWNVDHLLDQMSAEIVNIFAIRSDKKLEAELGRFLVEDLHTIVFEKGLGANDVPGNTHLVRVEADEIW